MRPSIRFWQTAFPLVRRPGRTGLTLALVLALSACGSKHNDSSSTAASPTGTLALYAGLPGVYGILDGVTLASSRLSAPQSIAADGNGNFFIADTANNTIRWMLYDASTSSWVLRTLAGAPGVAGSTNGNTTQALFNAPAGIVYVPAQSALYVADTGNNTIRKITFTLGSTIANTTVAVTTFAGTAGVTGSANGQGAAASFNAPTGIAADGTGVLYVTDTANQQVRRIDTSGTASTLAGVLKTVGAQDGAGTVATFNAPVGVVVEGTGSSSLVFVADSGNSVIREIDASGNVSTFAGTAGAIGSTDLQGTQARFYGPTGLSLDAQNNIYVADSGNDLIRMIDSSANVTTLAGTVGSAGSEDGVLGLGSATFSGLQGVLFVPNAGAGDMYVADTDNDTIRQVVLQTSGSTLVAGQVSTLVGAAGLSGSQDGTGTAARMELPQNMVMDSAGNIYVADFAANDIREITADGELVTLAGDAGGAAGFNDGPGNNALFNGPYGIAIDETVSSTPVLYVTDNGNNLIRRLTLASNGSGGWNATVDTLAGQMQTETSSSGTVLAPIVGAANGTGPAAEFNGPLGIVVNPATHEIYVADSLNDTIRLVTPAGVVSLYAGKVLQAGYTDSSLSSSQFSNPSGLAISGIYLYVADYTNNTVRRMVLNGVAPPTGQTAVQTVAGTAGTSGTADGNALTTATFGNPTGLAADESGNIFVADTGSNTIREVSNGTVTTIAGTVSKAGFLPGNLPGLLNGPVGLLYFHDTTAAKRYLYVTSSTVIGQITLP